MNIIGVYSSTMNIQLPTKYANFSDDDSSELVYMEQL